MPRRRFKISYDLLDGASLEFDESEEEEEPKTPFIPNPFSENYPPAGTLENDQSFEKRLRPYLFWAAMNLAAPDNKGQQRAVLISITQQIGGYAEDLLKLLNKQWKDVDKPIFFEPPSDPKKQEIWQRCLDACEDYFTKKSRKYQLLEKGIVVHHGKMPGLMARLLIEVIDQRIVHLVMATSTLSEGVNLPFETVLIPSLKRYSGDLSLREFNNLVGRAGRPGFATEGRSLVLLHQGTSTTNFKIKQKREKYFSLIEELKSTKNNDNEANPISPLAKLLSYIKEKWQQISSSNSNTDFLTWLENTAINEDNNEEFLTWLENTAPIDVENNDAVESLDSLDHILLSLIVELEQIEGQELKIDDLEAQLQSIWQRSYAYYATQEEQRLEEIFIKRGMALKTTVYQDLSQRRRLYRTSLPPRTGNQLLSLYPEIKQHLMNGQDYVNYSSDEKLNYLKNIIKELNNISKFSFKDPRGNVTWEEILSWWLTHHQASKQPTKTQVSDWHKYVSDNFQYRFNWGLGSVIALAIDETFDGEIIEPSLEDWAKTGLPWIVFWIKELIVWGTLDPVAAYLLARVENITTRSQAEEIAQTYYESEIIKTLSANEQLNAKLLKDWVKNSFSNLPASEGIPQSKPPRQLSVHLLRNFSNASNQKWKVIPVETAQEIYWFDLAGFQLAKCQKGENWNFRYLNDYDFILDTNKQMVTTRKFL
ncbi:MAG: hypothetical protein AB4063_25645 [Crocosphaera sp.]